MNQYINKGGKAILKFDFNRELLDNLKETFEPKERKYDPISKSWTITVSILNSKLVDSFLKKWGFSQKELKNDDSSTSFDITAYLKQKDRRGDVKSFLNQIKQLNNIIVSRPYQETGINTMCSWDRMINGDDMGLGKSVQTIYTAEIRNKFPVLLICESSTKYQWMELWKKIKPDREISVIDTKNKKNNWAADVVIINYEMIRSKEIIEVNGEEKEIAKAKFNELIDTKWGYVVFDEIHRLTNQKSLQSRVAKKISKKAEVVHGLSGTLSKGKPMNIANPLSVVGCFDDVFGSFISFANRYCDPKQMKIGSREFTDYSGSSNEIELNELLRATCYIRREKREVAKELPPLQESVLEIPLSNSKTYSKAKERFISYLTDNFSSEVVDKALNAEYLVQRNHLRQLSLKGKQKGFIDWLENFREETDEKILVVSNFTEPLDVLSIHFDADIIDGRLDSKQKRDAIKYWAVNKSQFLFANIRAIGTGTDGLQDICSNMVVLDLPDKSYILDQLKARLERIGQKSNIFVYYLLSRETIDIDLWENVEESRRVSDGINKGIKVEPRDLNKIILCNYLG